MRAALGGLVGGLLAAHVADVGAAVEGGVGVHDFAVEARIGDTQAIAFTDHRRSVHDGDDEVFRVFAPADESEDTVVGVIGVDPFEAVPVEIDLMKSRLGGIKMIEIVDEALDAAVGIMLEEMPIKAVGLFPFGTLGEFLTHEEELLSRVSVLIGVEEAEIGELLPRVTGHFVKKRIFSMDDFVVGERKKEIFSEGVEKRECELVVFVFTVDRIVGKIF